MTSLTPAQRLKQVGNYLNMSTPLGLGIAILGRAERTPGPRGLILAERYRLKFPIAGAFTVGNVVISPYRFAQRRDPEELLAHEEQHSWQWLACGGLPFLVAYTAAMGWSWLRTGDRASHNWFEVRAGLASGGYRRRPTRNPIVAVRNGLRAAIEARLSGRGQNPTGAPNGLADATHAGDGAA